MIKGRIDPSALPNLGKDQSDQLKFLIDTIHQYLIPSFNKSLLALDGSMVALNNFKYTILSSMPHVRYLFLLNIGKPDSGLTAGTYSGSI
jgi:hypothetical protein